MHYIVIEALQIALKEKPNYGICGVINNLELEDTTYYYKLLVKSCEDLGFYSGVMSMPISVDHGEPYALYKNARRKGKMWKATTRYGAARRAVANKMIKVLNE